MGSLLIDPDAGNGSRSGSVTKPSGVQRPGSVRVSLDRVVSAPDLAQYASFDASLCGF